MSLTRANTEQILIRRCGKLLTAAGLDGTTVAGNNADLNDPLGWALRKSGYSVASVAAIADADLAAVSADDTDKLLDLAELRALETILGNLDDVDITLGQRSESLSQLSAQVEKKLTRLQARVEKAYGVGIGTLQAGMITNLFAEHDTTDDDD